MVTWGLSFWLPQPCLLSQTSLPGARLSHQDLSYPAVENLLIFGGCSLLPGAIVYFGCREQLARTVTVAAVRYRTLQWRPQKASRAFRICMVMVLHGLLLESSVLASSGGGSGARASAPGDGWHACLLQRRLHTLLCGSPWLGPLNAGRTCTSPFSPSPPHANLDRAHPKTLPFFSPQQFVLLWVWLLTS